MAGDLPPNSRITGVRFSAAEAITFLPVAPEPVKIMRSKASLENSMPTPPVSSMKTSLSSGKYLGESSLSRRVSERLFSDILTITRLPAANAIAIWDTDRNTGKFHGIMRPTTPRG